MIHETKHPNEMQDYPLKLLIFLVLLLALPISSLAIDYQGNCSVEFQGSSTLHDFDGKGSCMPFSASENADVMTTSELSIAVAGMDTDNSRRDKKMRKMFDAESYPLIKATIEPVSLTDIRKALLEDKDSTTEVTFQLKIRNIEQPVTAILQNIVATKEKITANLVFTLSLADYGLKPPSVLGFIRVDDSVKVKTSLTLETR